jgi:hypothetical protein
MSGGGVEDFCRWIALACCAMVLAACEAPAVRAATPAAALDRVFLEDELGPDATPAARGRIVGLWFVQFEESSAFSIDPAHVRIALTCLHFCGNSRRELEAVAGAAIASSGSRPTVFVGVPIPRDVPWGVYRVGVLDDGHVATWSSGAPAALPDAGGVVSIPPAGGELGIDDHLREIRDEYVGQTVQGFGPIEVLCDDPDSVRKTRAYDAALGKIPTRVDETSPSSIGEVLAAVRQLPPRPTTSVTVGNEPSLVVATVERPAAAQLRAWKIGGPVYQRWSTDDHFTAVSPLEITFTAESFGTHGCVRPRLWLADSWEVRRILWIHKPVGIRESTPIVRGMSKMTVAHILGFPKLFGTVAEMLRLDVWELPPVLPPFSARVRFRDGVVSSYDPPGQPP